MYKLNKKETIMYNYVLNQLSQEETTPKTCHLPGENRQIRFYPNTTSEKSIYLHIQHYQNAFSKVKRKTN